ncbi:unnamed protein product [Hermetia illucens]|uniref:Cuticle protein 6 n=2 Tax=Hermetia illucens TaxID=343691 RepID=A0A7R8UQ77_HERIL|nr:unnamed protein product [Hermetia illucens]
MKPAVVITLCWLLALSDSHVLAAHNYLYPSPIPYALGYSYHNPTLFHPYTYDVALKEQLSNYQNEGVESDDGASSKLGVNGETVKDRENGVEIVKLPTSMPRTNGDLKYYTFSYPIVYTIPTPLSWPAASQFHRQDELGQYHYGYANALSAKEEVKTLDGVTRGSYSYIDSNHKLQTVHYVSDAAGFRVSATNLPKDPEPVEIPDSDEIRLAKLEHFKAQHEALERLRIANLEDARRAESEKNL